MAKQHECQDEIEITFTFTFSSNPHLQILVSSFTRCGFLFAANSHFNAPAFLALDIIVVIGVTEGGNSNSSASKKCLQNTNTKDKEKNLNKAKSETKKKRRGQGQRMSHLRIAQTRPSWSSL